MLLFPREVLKEQKLKIWESQGSRGLKSPILDDVPTKIKDLGVLGKQALKSPIFCGFFVTS